jgi:hypothetical protein
MRRLGWRTAKGAIILAEKAKHRPPTTSLPDGKLRLPWLLPLLASDGVRFCEIL